MQSAEFTIAVFKFVLLIFSLSVHECSHAWMASRPRRSDGTAARPGDAEPHVPHRSGRARSSFLPSSSSGRFIGFSIFSGMLIGWAKPTPVISRNFAQNPPRREPGDPGRPGLEPGACRHRHGRCSWSSFTPSPGGREIVNFTLHGALLPGVAPIRAGRGAARCRRRRDQSVALRSSTCCRFRRSMAATCCAICCPTTPCSPTTAFPIG